MSRENLERVLDSASHADWEIASQAWFRYQRIVTGIAATFGFSATTGAAVFAALSPNNDYIGNIRDTVRLLAAAAGGRSLQDFKVSTYGENKKKAWRIAHGENPLDLIVANKTRNFFLNILDPADPLPVTVDGHIFNAWNGRRIPLNGAAMKAYGRYYSEVADIIRQLGVERRLLPNVVQGLIWYAWKRQHRIKHTDQMEFWPVDYLTAGFGFMLENGADGQDRTDGLLRVEQMLCH